MSDDLLKLAERVRSGTGISNSLDSEIEIALFNPPEDGFVSVRRNSAWSKLIYTDAAGKETTYWPMDWTMDRLNAAALLEARARSAA